MAKTVTSHTREKSWSGKPLKLGPHAQARPHDPTVTLRDPKIIREAILQALMEGDYQAVMEIYRAHLRVLNRSHAANGMGISRQYVHKMIRTANKPSLRTFAAFMGMLGKRE